MRCALPELVALRADLHRIRSCPDWPALRRTGATDHVQLGQEQRDLLAVVEGNFYGI